MAGLGDILGRSIQGGQMLQSAGAAEIGLQRAEQTQALKQAALGMPMSQTPGSSQVDQNISPTQALAQMAVLDPAAFESINKSIGLNTQSKKNEAADFAFRVQNLPFDQRDAAIQERITSLESQGRDATHTKQLIGVPEDVQNETLAAVQVAALSPKERANLASGVGMSKTQFGAQETFKDSEGTIFFGTTKRDPRTGGVGSAVVAADGSESKPVGKLSLVSGAGLTSAETVTQRGEIARQEADVKKTLARETEGEKVTGKEQAKRRQEQINRGLDAADSMANLKRAEDLLRLVETGGVDAVSLRAKQLFGVEGQNEAELSNRLGKAVLTQLRATFGAAFTEREGATLADIEAGFGKSTAGNKRLIAQTIRIVERAANRGIKAAEAAGDDEAAQDIRDALEFTLDDSPKGNKVGRFVVEAE